MKASVFFLCILFSGFTIVRISAQDDTKKSFITGTVLDLDSLPVANAIIMIDGQKTNIMTNAQGKYKIKAKPDAVSIGIVSFKHGIIEEEIAGRNLIDFSYQIKSVQQASQTDSEVSSDNELVNTGYNSVRKENLTTTISKVDGTNKKRSYSSIYEMLQDLPGVRVTGRSVVVQESMNTFGYVYPLFIVDGVPVESIDDISPSMVESIEVLKGNAAAIYGTRAAGGVILITRKSMNTPE